MQSRREYAASLGLAIAGARGKFSNAAKEAIAKAEAEGMRFSDSPATAPVVRPENQSTSSSTINSAIARITPENSLYISPSDFRYPEGEYVAVAKVGGKKYSVRECCNNCRVSLTNHACSTPTIHGNIEVTMKEVRA